MINATVVDRLDLASRQMQSRGTTGVTHEHKTNTVPLGTMSAMWQ